MFVCRLFHHKYQLSTIVILSRLPGDNPKSISADSTNSLGGDEADNKNISLRYPPEYFVTLTPSAEFPHASLNFKPSSIVMLL